MTHLALGQLPPGQEAPAAGLQPDHVARDALIPLRLQLLQHAGPEEDLQHEKCIR